MNGCHICEVPEPVSVEQLKERIAFIAFIATLGPKGTPMFAHVVEHVAKARKTGKQK